MPANLVLAAQNKSELAGALAHAMIHIAERHGFKASPQGQPGQLATIPLVFVGGMPESSGVLLPAGYRQAQRTFESETDVLAVKLLADAGFDPRGLASYIGRVQRDPNIAEFSALPPRDERIAAIEHAIAAMTHRGYTISTDFNRVQDEVRRLPPPERAAPTLKR